MFQKIILIDDDNYFKPLSGGRNSDIMDQLFNVQIYLHIIMN